MNDHTVKSYDDELAHLANVIARMGGIAEAQLAGAIQALSSRDDAMARQVIAGDAQVDELDHEIQAFAVRLLALRQPMASDLRQIVGAMNIAGEIERIGDYAANLAKRGLIINHLPVAAEVSGVVRLAELVRGLVADILDATARLDVDKAIRVWNRDEEVDALYNTVFQDLISQMTNDPGAITAATHLMFMAKNIERIGDHATNIAEALHYQVRGVHPQGERPKGETLGGAA